MIHLWRIIFKYSHEMQRLCMVFFLCHQHWEIYFIFYSYIFSNVLNICPLWTMWALLTQEAWFLHYRPEEERREEDKMSTWIIQYKVEIIFSLHWAIGIEHVAKLFKHQLLLNLTISLKGRNCFSTFSKEKTESEKLIYLRPHSS